MNILKAHNTINTNIVFVKANIASAEAWSQDFVKSRQHTTMETQVLWVRTTVKTNPISRTLWVSIHKLFSGLCYYLKWQQPLLLVCLSLAASSDLMSFARLPSGALSSPVNVLKQSTFINSLMKESDVLDLLQTWKQNTSWWNHILNVFAICTL